MVLEHDKQKRISIIMQQFLVTFGRRELEIYSRLLFTDINLRYFRAETTLIMLVSANTGITVSIASRRILE